MNAPIQAARSRGGASLAFAWRSLVRQPARAALGLLGVAAIGALLFDMLLLSNGLVTSMEDLFDRAGFDLRITATDALPGQGPRVRDAAAAVAAIAAVPGVRSAVALRVADALVEVPGQRPVRALLQGADGPGTRPWTLRAGRDATGDREVLVNENAAGQLGLEPGDRVIVRGQCADDQSPPPIAFTVIGVAEFPFDSPTRSTLAATMAALEEACGRADAGQADMILVASGDSDPAGAAARVAAAVPQLAVRTNEEMVARLQRGGFTYFRQISTVLTTVTLAFAVLLISVLLTVSVNQRLGEVAALRALGFTRWRVAADVICESALIVIGGGALSLPLGLALARALDAILKDIPGVPAGAHFFVFQPQALGLHAAMLVGTAVVAALYPVHLVARLPIAATLRDEVVG